MDFCLSSQAGRYSNDLRRLGHSLGLGPGGNRGYRGGSEGSGNWCLLRRLVDRYHFRLPVGKEGGPKGSSEACRRRLRGVHVYRWRRRGRGRRNDLGFALLYDLIIHNAFLRGEDRGAQAAGAQRQDDDSGLHSHFDGLIADCQRLN